MTDEERSSKTFKIIGIGAVSGLILGLLFVFKFGKDWIKPGGNIPVVFGFTFMGFVASLLFIPHRNLA